MAASVGVHKIILIKNRYVTIVAENMANVCTVLGLEIGRGYIILW